MEIEFPLPGNEGTRFTDEALSELAGLLPGTPVLSKRDGDHRRDRIGEVVRVVEKVDGRLRVVALVDDLVGRAIRPTRFGLEANVVQCDGEVTRIVGTGLAVSPRSGTTTFGKLTESEQQEIWLAEGRRRSGAAE